MAAIAAAKTNYKSTAELAMHDGSCQTTAPDPPFCVKIGYCTFMSGWMGQKNNKIAQLHKNRKKRNTQAIK